MLKTASETNTNSKDTKSSQDNGGSCVTPWRIPVATAPLPWSQPTKEALTRLVSPLLTRIRSLKCTTPTTASTQRSLTRLLPNWRPSFFSRDATQMKSSTKARSKKPPKATIRFIHATDLGYRYQEAWPDLAYQEHRHSHPSA